jgi:phosphate starvation-inducible membrane PsiE
MSDAQDDAPTPTTKIFLLVEHAVYIALGVLLSVLALVALAHAALGVLQSFVDWNNAELIFTIMDQLLFVLMLAEILHTVRVSIRSGTLTAEPFLIVGLIASIRRVLVITLESSKAQKDQSWSPDRVTGFHASMIELGVLAMLILVMVLSIYLIRQSALKTKIPGAKPAPGLL